MTKSLVARYAEESSEFWIRVCVSYKHRHAHENSRVHKSHFHLCAFRYDALRQVWHQWRDAQEAMMSLIQTWPDMSWGVIFGCMWMHWTEGKRANNFILALTVHLASYQTDIKSASEQELVTGFSIVQCKKIWYSKSLFHSSLLLDLYPTSDLMEKFNQKFTFAENHLRWVCFFIRFWQM